MASPPLSPQVFAILAALIEERAGLHYALADRDLLAEKMAPRVQDAGFDSLLDYYYFLRYDPGGEDELQALIETLVVHETYFFREYDPLRALVDEVVVPWVEAGRRVRLWSAACSTGEEPYSLAMMLADRDVLDRVTLIASDVSGAAIARARAARYRGRSLRSVPAPHLVSRYLNEGAPGEWTVDERVRSAVDFRTLNLLDRKGQERLGRFDVVICRNVLIYFRDETARAVVDNLTRALEPDGVLCVGVSESLLRFGHAVECEERGGAFFYRRSGSVR